MYFRISNTKPKLTKNKLEMNTTKRIVLTADSKYHNPIVYSLQLKRSGLFDQP